MASARDQLRRVAVRLAGYPKAQALLVAAEDDILAHMALPESHRRRMHSTNTLERPGAEIKRRSKVVGVFPNPASVERLLGAVLMEQDEEWQAADRCYLALDQAPADLDQNSKMIAAAE